VRLVQLGKATAVRRQPLDRVVLRLQKGCDGILVVGRLLRAVLVRDLRQQLMLFGGEREPTRRLAPCP